MEAMTRTVTLVDEAGTPIGEADILAAHTGEGKLHRAFWVFVFTPDFKKTMIQQRSVKKMLWAGSWANTCCSHPFSGEIAVAAGQRRLKEELGFTCDLKEGKQFVYRARDPNGNGVEHEHDTILIGTMLESSPVVPNPDEVSEWKWISIDALQKDLKANPDAYTPWLHIGLPLALPHA